MSFANPDTPDLADFTTFAYDQGVPTADLPTDSPYLQWAFTLASDTVLIPPGDMPPILYVLAVYNFGMHQLVKMAQDQAGQDFFANARKNFNLTAFSAGVLSATSDNGTSSTLTVPESMQNLTLQDLDLLRTPWGREYLMYAQSYGPSIVGVS